MNKHIALVLAVSTMFFDGCSTVTNDWYSLTLNLESPEGKRTLYESVDQTNRVIGFLVDGEFFQMTPKLKKDAMASFAKQFLDFDPASVSFGMTVSTNSGYGLASPPTFSSWNLTAPDISWMTNKESATYNDGFANRILRYGFRDVHMKFHENEEAPNLERLSPLLDAALSKLSSKDRDAVLLHYFEQKSFRAIGSVFGLSDDAAQKRVSRALDKLRVILIRTGVGVSISSLSNLLSAGPLPSVPADMALSVAKFSLKQATAMGPQSWTERLIQNLIAAKAKLACVGLLMVLCCELAYLVKDRNSFPVGKFTTIDISAYYNGRLNKSWTPAYDDNDLALLGEGLRLFKKVPFEIHGVIQLQGTEWKKRGYSYPESITGIPVGKKGQRLHLLHADSAFAEPTGTTVASLILHYSNGDETHFDIRQGIEVLDWWDWPRAPIRQPADTNTIVAWSGSNPAAQHQGASIRLFDTAFVNPHPEMEIKSIDYTSAMAGSAPFMVALTIER